MALGLLLIVSVSASLNAAECEECASADAMKLDWLYTGEVWRQASGGIERGTRYLDNLDLTLDVDGERAFGLPGLQLFGYALYNNGNVLCDELVGSAQCVSNIESIQALRLYEAWAQWKSQHEFSLKAGLYDLNSEFDSIESAALFISPSHGIGPDFSQTGLNGPSIFPVTSLGLRAMQTLGAWTVQAAVLDAVPGDPGHPKRTAVQLSSDEGALLIGEVNYRFESGARVGSGYWRYTAKFDDAIAVDEQGEPLQRSGNDGAYLIIESPAFFARERQGGINVFARAGTADRRFNAVETYFGAGAVYSTAARNGRERALGVALAIAELGTPYRAALASGEVASDAREYNWEATYRMTVNDWLTLQSDVQYTHNPGMDPERRSSWSVGLRFEIGYGWAW